MIFGLVCNILIAIIVGFSMASHTNSIWTGLLLGILFLYIPFIVFGSLHLKQMLGLARKEVK